MHWSVVETIELNNYNMQLLSAHLKVKKVKLGYIIVRCKA